MSMPVNQSGTPDVDGRWRRWLGQLWPGRCLACAESSPGGRDLCESCFVALPWNRHACARCAIPLPAVTGATATAAAQHCGECLRKSPPVQATCATFVYAAPLDRLLPRFKFHHDLAAGRLLAQLMAQACASVERPRALVPIPLHRIRLRSRGYDQALELAKPLARALRLPMLPDALRRIRATAPQSELDAERRRRNLRRAFDVRRDAPLPAHVALVDDVMTTGATLHAAADALRRAGVARVDAWVCARVP
jgi:ComF family protein